MLQLIRNLIKAHNRRTGKPYKGVFQLRYGNTLIVKYTDENPIEIGLEGVHNIKTYWGENNTKPIERRNTEIYRKL